MAQMKFRLKKISMFTLENPLFWLLLTVLTDIVFKKEISVLLNIGILLLFLITIPVSINNRLNYLNLKYEKMLQIRGGLKTDVFRKKKE